MRVNHRRMDSRRLVTFAGVASTAVVVVAPGFARPQTTTPPEIIPIKITLTDSAIQVHPKAAPRAAFGRFILRNRGSKPHAFTLGSPKARFGMQTGFTKVLKPGKQITVVLFLEYRSKIPYHGSRPAAKGKASMRGYFRIY